MAVTDVERMRRMSYEMWDRLAPTWGHRRDWIEASTTPVREWIVRALDPRPGQTLLELAAGAGDTGFEAAGRIGPSGHLISSDFAPAMVELARRRATALKVSGVEFRTLDAEDMDLPDDSVDGVICRMGYMLMPDPGRAFAETRRVLRPGGRLAAAVFGPPQRNPLFAALAGAMAEAGNFTPPPPGAPGPFGLADPIRLRTLVEQAGFTSVDIEEVALRFHVRDAQQHVEIAADTSGPLAVALRSLSDAERGAVVDRLARALEPFRGPDGHDLPGLAFCVCAS